MNFGDDDDDDNVLRYKYDELLKLNEHIHSKGKKILIYSCIRRQ